MILSGVKCSVKMSVGGMERILTLSKREQKRLLVLNEVEKGKMRMGQAAEVLGISERQGWRILAAYREGRAAGL